MAATLIFPRTPGKIGSLQLDVTVSETHEYNAKATQFPVEDGSTITDHIINDPIQVQMEGFVTNNPIVLTTGFDENVDRGAGSNKDELALAALMDIRDKREPIDIVTGMRKYSSMAMISLSIPRDAGTGAAFRFSATFVEVRKVSSKYVKLPNLKDKDGTKQQGAPQVDKGKQPTEPEPKPPESTLHQWSMVWQ